MNAPASNPAGRPGRPGGLVADLRVRQGAFRLDVALRAAPGQVLAVVGPNGAGKSTLLRALAGLLPLEDGRVDVGARTLADAGRGLHVPPHERRVGVVFQDYRLFPHLRVRDNVAFGLRARGTPRREARVAADAWLERLGLHGLGDRRPAALSGGQAQRVALARALAVEPGLLLLDEPLAALDAGTRAAVRADLRRHLRGFGGPSLLVTHDPLEAMTLADRLLVLEDGRAVQEGPPADVARRPRTRYVGSLVGLNVYRGRAAEGVLAVDGGGQLAFAGPLAGRAVGAVRPDAVTLHVAPPGTTSSRNVWRAVLETLEPFGDRVRATLRGDLPLLADVTVAAVAELRLQPGDELWASVKATEVDVYPDEQPQR